MTETELITFKNSVKNEILLKETNILEEATK